MKFSRNIFSQMQHNIHRMNTAIQFHFHSHFLRLLMSKITEQAVGVPTLC